MWIFKAAANILISEKVLLLGTLVAFTMSVHCDWGTAQWLWFQRSGSLAVLFGGVLTFRRLIRFGPKKQFQESKIISGGHAAPTPEEIQADAEEWKDTLSSYVGVWLMVIGTVIWGYGDLLGKVF